jgi:DNA polymerase III delta prime subunit
MDNVWIEKYRPNNFENIIGQKKNIELIKNLIKNKSFPHLLFHGKSGIGKTSTINAIVNEIYGKDKNFMVMKLDASDDRGINTVREEIKGFAEKMTLFCNGVKLIILDEVDSMTFDAQFALRRIIEKYSDTTRFCLICNYENKIIQPIKSRCVDIRFYPIENDIIISRLKNICDSENIDYDIKGIKTIVSISNGDMRKAINILQSLSSIGQKVTAENCNDSNGIPSNKVVKKLIKYLLDNKKSFNKVFDYVKENILNEGISLSLLLRTFIIYFISMKEDIIKDKGPEKYANYIIEIGDLENKVSISTFSDIYIVGLIAIFKQL